MVQQNKMTILPLLYALTGSSPFHLKWEDPFLPYVREAYHLHLK
jgi:hypothetical protein